MKGEDKLIELIKKFEIGKRRLKGNIGDDCAYLIEKEGSILVLSVDSQVEGIHFKREWISPQDIGYRAMAAALSDLAAKGANPLVALVDLHITSPDSEEFITKVYEGMYILSRKFNFSIAGGNITEDRSFSLSITVIGETDYNIPRRNNARVGDYVYLTGDIGRSKLFLELAEKAQDIPLNVFNKFKRPVPKFSLMRKINQSYKVNASIDISDGLGKDASRVAKSSGVDIYIYEARVPIHPVLKQYGKDVLFALGSGEEYEVLFTSKDIIKKRGVSLIGEVKRGEGRVIFINSIGEKQLIEFLGFDHLIKE